VPGHAHYVVVQNIGGSALYGLTAPQLVTYTDVVGAPAAGTCVMPAVTTMPTLSGSSASLGFTSDVTAIGVYLLDSTGSKTLGVGSVSGLSGATSTSVPMKFACFQPAQTGYFAVSLSNSSVNSPYGYASTYLYAPSISTTNESLSRTDGYSSSGYVSSGLAPDTTPFTPSCNLPTMGAAGPTFSANPAANGSTVTVTVPVSAAVTKVYVTLVSKASTSVTDGAAVVTVTAGVSPTVAVNVNTTSGTTGTFVPEVTVVDASNRQSTYYFNSNVSSTDYSIVQNDGFTSVPATDAGFAFATLTMN